MTRYTIFVGLFLAVSLPGLGQKAVPILPKGEVIYHVCQRSFFDSNGDTQGDLNGLRQKLDYLQGLGVTSILLLPLYEADCYHNYFASDFETIDPEFGTTDDYIRLVKDVHRRGMKIYLDMETQYVAAKHRWWKDAVGNLNSPFSDYILFDDAAHRMPATMIFNLRELVSYDGTVVPITTVNLKNPDVLAYNVKLFSYFLDPNKDGKFEDGADGFRLDHAMDHLDGKPTLTNLFATFWKPLITQLKRVNPAVTMMAEQADWADVGFDYFARAGVDRMFGFGLQRAILSFNKQQLINKADSVLGLRPAGKDQLIFLENHDLDRFASLEPDARKQRVAATLQLLIGGVPSIYYGQEIGMQGRNGSFGNTDGNDILRRQAMDWYAGGEGPGTAVWYKNTGQWWAQSTLKANDGVSVAEQTGSPTSLLSYYKKLIALKQNNPSLATGRYQNAENTNAAVYGFYRTNGPARVLVLVNLTDQPQQTTLTGPGQPGKLLLGSPTRTQGTVGLAPYEVGVWEIR